jgi:hypothetical protein
MKLRIEPISILVVFIIGVSAGIVAEEDKPNSIDILPESQNVEKYGE